MGSERLKFVWRCDEWQLSDLCHFMGYRLRKTRFGIEPGTYGSAALSQRVDIG